MGDMGDIFNAMKREKKKRRQDSLLEAPDHSPLGPWKKHTEYHYGAYLQGHKLDWYPSARKWIWWKDGKPRTGTYEMLNNWIQRRITEENKQKRHNSPENITQGRG